ncbi:MAG: Eco29kI family restriction endonuclease [Akkermansia sp.]
MKIPPFDRSKHVYKNDALVELIKDAVRFFNGTPIVDLPLPERFEGTGVYSLYYTGKNNIYRRYFEANRISYDKPIYIGKAVPCGWRQSRISDSDSTRQFELYRRISEHVRNIDLAHDLNISDFHCRFIVFESTGSDMIGTVEASLIKLYNPLWNSAVDGFGNHDPGAGRYQQAKSDWDVLHSGRSWALKCEGVPKDISQIKMNIDEYFKKYFN